MKLNPIYRGILCCTLAAPGVALAQDSGEAIEEIVVTGSLIRGTPEDAALPVEVHTSEDLRLSGAPTALEFAKTLTASGPTSGEAHYFGGAENTGNVQFNLRGIGADKTLTLFNGRRISQNTSIIPGIATQRIEVLKDGAAVTYGADATGGVVNFITRDRYEGFEVDASYKYIDGSDGDYDIAMMGGFGGDDTNFIWAAEWDHRSELDASERSFSSLPYAVNPAPWSQLTNVSRWFAHAGLPPTPTSTLNQFGAPSGEFGTMLGVANDFDQGSCETVGGIYDPDDNNGVTPQFCRYGYLPFYNLVEDQDIYRLYGQVTSDVTDNMEFYLRAAFARVHTPHAYGSPSQPVVRGPARHNGLVAQFYVPRGTASNPNPYWDEFATRSGLTGLTLDHDGDPTTPRVPGYGAVQGATAITYRAFAHGGNDVFAEGDNHSTPREIDNKYWHIATGLKGEWDNGMGYDFGLTYNQTVAYNDNPDIIAFRLQEALSGFGGPNCAAADLDPDRYGTQNPEAAGKNGCMWFNPFASNFAGNPALGTSNPAYGGAGFENSPELVRWMYDKRAQETVSDDVTVDFVVDGDTPIELPGGSLAWAAGVQWRTSHSREFVESDFYNGSQPCQWPASEGQEPLPANHPDFTSCGEGNPGPFQFFGINEPDRLEQDQKSAFVEFNIPVLDSLNFGAAARYEEFNSDLDTTVYKVSGKWQATDNLAFRGAYGTNYQAPGIGVTPGEVNNGVNSYSIAGNAWLGATTVTRSDIEPETATVWSFGTIWQSAGFSDDHDVQVIIDYFNIETEDELGLLASANDVAEAVFHIDAGPNQPNLADCAHPLADRITFNGGCTQGTTTARDFASVTTEFGNGPTQHTAGYDIQLNYGMPFMQGDLRFGLTATKIQKFDFGEISLDGYVIKPEEDRLGKLNFATIAFAASEWRANANVNYAQDIHNLRLVLNYISGVEDERFRNADGSVNVSGMTPAGVIPGTLQEFAFSDYGMEAKDWITADLHYTVDLPWESTFSFSIHNLTDEAPPESRQELGYDPRIGNPLMRTFEVGFQKRF